MKRDDAVLKTLTLEADALVNEVRPLFAGRDPDVVGAALGELFAIWLASHAPALREENYTLVTDLARDLVPIIVEQMIDHGRCGEDWRATNMQWKTTKRRSKT